MASRHPAARLSATAGKVKKCWGGCLHVVEEHLIAGGKDDYTNQNGHCMLGPSFQHAGPKQVKMLLNAQGPQMSKDPRPSEIKVDQVKKGGGDVIPTQPTPIENRDNDQEHYGGGKDSKRPPNIELLEANGPAALPLFKQDLGNQVPGNHIEDADANDGIVLPEKFRPMQPARQMTEDHQENRDRPQAVERGNALHIGMVS